MLSRIVNATDLATLNSYTSNLPFDLTPPTDARPFFFNQLPLSHPMQALAFARGVLATTAEGGGVRRGNLVATVTLLILFVIALVLVSAALIIPLRSALNDVGVKYVTYGTLYFSLIGVGFMMIEIGLLQRMSIFLGHPVYSLSVLLSTLILTTGIGSFVSEKLPLQSARRLTIWSAATAAYAARCRLLLVRSLSLSALRIWRRESALCVTVITPMGCLLGFGFPTGMRLIAAIDPSPTPWFWGINGAAGVLASIVAVALSMAWGIGATLIVGSLCYLSLIPVSSALLQSERITEVKKPIKTAAAPRRVAGTTPARSR